MHFVKHGSMAGCDGDAGVELTADLLKWMYEQTRKTPASFFFAVEIWLMVPRTPPPVCINVAWLLLEPLGGGVDVHALGQEKEVARVLNALLGMPIAMIMQPQIVMALDDCLCEYEWSSPDQAHAVRDEALDILAREYTSPAGWNDETPYSDICTRVVTWLRVHGQTNTAAAEQSV